MSITPEREEEFLNKKFKMKFRLLEEDRTKINGELRKQRKNQTDLAKHLGIDQTKISRILSPQLVSEEQLKAIYEYLGKPESLDFISQYPEKSHRKEFEGTYSGVAGAWRNLYDEHTIKLRYIYMEVNSPNKQKLISKIEQLIDEFSPDQS
jgi:transcriptional regulator with XRE-family HTH domain|tara:strand:- start:190 stop:642 length:453 start_codon:yes stop_codon:yes gene_type:complete